jgi:hypothetical protein
MVIGNTVIVGTGNDLDSPGYLQAYDADSGKELWRFYTVPQNPGEPGADTWLNIQAARYGGGHPWLPGVYDPETNLYIFGTGNPIPAYTLGRGDGDNLYTCSLIAVDVATGKMKWYFQTSPHDMHDWDSAQTPVLFEAVGTQIIERTDWDQTTLTHEPQVLGQSAHMWTRTSLRPSDVDVAELYDGFSFNCLSWIEALGFCGWGEAKDFLDGGTNIAPDGVLPLNTHGGQLSSGRLHGYGFIHEAVTQLRGHAGERQVANAETAVVSNGGGAPGGVFLFTKAR